MGTTSLSWILISTLTVLKVAHGWKWAIGTRALLSGVPSVQKTLLKTGFQVFGNIFPFYQIRVNLGGIRLTHPDTISKLPCKARIHDPTVDLGPGSTSSLKYLGPFVATWRWSWRKRGKLGDFIQLGVVVWEWKLALRKKLFFFSFKGVLESTWCQSFCVKCCCPQNVGTLPEKVYHVPWVNPKDSKRSKNTLSAQLYSIYLPLKIWSGISKWERICKPMEVFSHLIDSFSNSLKQATKKNTIRWSDFACESEVMGQKVVSSNIFNYSILLLILANLILLGIEVDLAAKLPYGESPATGIERRNSAFSFGVRTCFVWVFVCFFFTSNRVNRGVSSFWFPSFINRW